MYIMRHVITDDIHMCLILQGQLPRKELLLKYDLLQFAQVAQAVRLVCERGREREGLGEREDEEEGGGGGGDKIVSLVRLKGEGEAKG